MKKFSQNKSLIYMSVLLAFITHLLPPHVVDA